MTPKSEKDRTAASVAAAADPDQHLQLGVRLQPVDHSDQPVFANFSVVQAAPGLVFLDFGFLEPSVLPAMFRLAKGGGKMPEAVNGRLEARVVLGVDAAAQLMQQLERHLRGGGAQAQRPATAAQAASR